MKTPLVRLLERVCGVRACVRVRVRVSVSVRRCPRECVRPCECVRVRVRGAGVFAWVQVCTRACVRVRVYVRSWASELSYHNEHFGATSYISCLFNQLPSQTTSGSSAFFKFEEHIPINILITVHYFKHFYLVSS